MYFRQFWRDPRLSFDKKPNLEKLVVGAEYIELIWVPDTFFVNEKTAYFHKATTENQFLRILHTGDILRSIRYGNMKSNKWKTFERCHVCPPNVKVPATPPVIIKENSYGCRISRANPDNASIPCCPPWSTRILQKMESLLAAFL